MASKIAAQMYTVRQTCQTAEEMAQSLQSATLRASPSAPRTCPSR